MAIKSAITNNICPDKTKTKKTKPKTATPSTTPQPKKPPSKPKVIPTCTKHQPDQATLKKRATSAAYHKAYSTELKASGGDVDKAKAAAKEAYRLAAAGF